MTRPHARGVALLSCGFPAGVSPDVLLMRPGFRVEPSRVFVAQWVPGASHSPSPERGLPRRVRPLRSPSARDIEEY